MIQPRNRNVPCCVYMGALAVSDTLMLYIGMHMWVANVGIVYETMARWECIHIVLVFQVSDNVTYKRNSLITYMLYIVFKLQLINPFHNAKRCPSIVKKTTKNHKKW